MLQIVTKSLVFIIFISVYNKLHNSKKKKKKKKNKKKKKKKKKNHKCSHEVHNHEFSNFNIKNKMSFYVNEKQ
jgi:hypothetical protein